MGLFSRRRRTTVEPYVPPAEPPPVPSLETQVEEGLLILVAGVRLTVKNQAIVWALRERTDFDPERYRAAVRTGLLAAADEADADADRATAEFGRSRTEDHGLVQQYPDEPTRLQRKAEVMHALAARLRELSHDDDYVDELATAARDAAWEDIGAMVKHNAMLSAPLARPVPPAQRHAALREIRRALDELQVQVRMPAQ